MLGLAVAVDPVVVEAPAPGAGEDPVQADSPNMRINPRPASPVVLVENIIYDSHDDPVSGNGPPLEPHDICFVE